jgi:hypothetical protein
VHRKKSISKFDYFCGTVLSSRTQALVIFMFCYPWDAGEDTPHGSKKGKMVTEVNADKMKDIWQQSRLSISSHKSLS